MPSILTSTSLLTRWSCFLGVHYTWKGIFIYPKDYSANGGWDYRANKFIAFFSSKSLWKGPLFNNESFCEPTISGEPIDTKSCPMIEKPGIIYSQAEKSDPAGFYYDGINTFNLIELDYNRLLSICGATTVCKINVGNYYPYKDKYYLDQNYGTVTVDTMAPDVVKITKLETDNDSPCTLKKKEPFNTIYCETKT